MVYVMACYEGHDQHFLENLQMSHLSYWKCHLYIIYILQLFALKFNLKFHVLKKKKNSTWQL